MREVELLLSLESLRDNNPVLYVVICCAAICLPFMWAACCFSYLYGIKKSRRNEKIKGALDLIGKTVTYQKDSLSFEGMVVSVDFDLDENDNLVETIYIDVDEFENYYKVKYKELGKTLFEKGGKE